MERDAGELSPVGQALWSAAGDSILSLLWFAHTWLNDSYYRTATRPTITPVVGVPLWGGEVLDILLSIAATICQGMMYSHSYVKNPTSLWYDLGGLHTATVPCGIPVKVTNCYNMVLLILNVCQYCVLICWHSFHSAKLVLYGVWFDNDVKTLMIIGKKMIQSIPV